MERENVSFPSTFILLGFSEFPRLEMPLSAVVLVSYILTLVGNSSIILLSLADPRLTPMYFFLDNLSLLDLSVTCTIVPQLLANLWGPDKTIAAWGCITQIYLFNLTACAECALLAVMAIDRYVAICRPLRYTLIMRPWVCVQMAAACWSSGLANSLLQTTLTRQLPLCGHHALDHFFCEVPVLIKLACGATTVNDRALALGAIPFALLAPLMVLTSYIFIARAVLKLPSAEGRHKALSTCSSHLLVVTLYFGPGMFLYLQPSAKSSQAKFLSFFYCVITPLLNPLIYTLRNKDVKTAWKSILQCWGSRQRGLEGRVPHSQTPTAHDWEETSLGSTVQKPQEFLMRKEMEETFSKSRSTVNINTASLDNSDDFEAGDMQALGLQHTGRLLAPGGHKSTRSHHIPFTS
ncbi:LOW QUALITY PROTEIN: olfactory receptor 2G3-like [Erethizon dorsatum]